MFQNVTNILLQHDFVINFTPINHKIPFIENCPLSFPPAVCAVVKWLTFIEVICWSDSAVVLGKTNNGEITASPGGAAGCQRGKGVSCYAGGAATKEVAIM